MQRMLAFVVVFGCIGSVARAAGLDPKVFKCEDKSAIAVRSWGGAHGKCLVQCAQKQLKDSSRSCTPPFDATTQACVDKAAAKVSATIGKSCPTGLPDCGSFAPTCDAGQCSNDGSHACSVDGDCPQSTPAAYATAVIASQAAFITPAANAFMCALRPGTCNAGTCSNDSAKTCSTSDDCPPNDVKDKCGPALVGTLGKLTAGLAKCFSKCNGKSLVKQDTTFQCLPDSATTCSVDTDCATDGGHCDATTHKCDPVAPLDQATKDCITKAESGALAALQKKCNPAPACRGGASFSASSALAVVTGALIPPYADPHATPYCLP